MLAHWDEKLKAVRHRGAETQRKRAQKNIETGFYAALEGAS